MHAFFQRVIRVRNKQVIGSIGIGLIVLFITLSSNYKKNHNLLFEKKLEKHNIKKNELGIVDASLIKGDKEQQILEIRALKGQIEEDIELFERIKKARVLLDFNPSKMFGQQKVSKASVILSLEDQVLLTESDLLAICYHICAAIQDLDIKQISISDTQGRLYKKHDSAVCFPYSNTSNKDVIVNRIQMVLEKVMGKEHYSFCIQENPLAIYFLFDEKFRFQQKSTIPHLIKQIEMVDPEITVNIDWAFFKEKTKDFSKIYWAVTIFFLISFGGIYGIKKAKEQKQVIKKGGKLADMIKDQPPKTLAIMLSYLEPKKAKKILEELPVAIQEAIANHYRIREGEGG